MADRTKVLTAEDILAIQAEKAKIMAEKLEAERQAKELEKQAKREQKIKERRLKKEAELRAKEDIRKEEEKSNKAAKEVIKKSHSTFSKENVTATRDEMAHTVHQKAKWFTLGRELGKPQSDAELEQRMMDFWKICEDSGEIPQKTDFFLFCNISANTYTLWKSGQGCSRERTELVEMFENMFCSVKDTLAGENKISSIPYIWQSKQWQGYREPKAELEVTNHNPMQMFPDALAVEQKYKDLLMGDTEVDPKYLTDVEVEENTND